MRIVKFPNTINIITNTTINTSNFIIFLLSLFLSGCEPISITGVNDNKTIQVPEIQEFNPQNAYNLIQEQLNYGPRTPGSLGHKKTQFMIQDKLTKYGWLTDIQMGEWNGYPVENIIGRREGNGPWIILGAHYDTRIYADQDPERSRRIEPVPGANDGASGVAVLLEIARIMPKDFPGRIYLIFFDAEDNGGIENRDWIMGSRFFVSKLNEKPVKMILLDMIADQELEIYFEKNSDEDLREEIWEVASQLGYGDSFIKVPKYRIIDDHVPFIQMGIPSVDIIDFDYPYWHTTSDTIDKISIRSLEIVGTTLYTWLMSISQ